MERELVLRTLSPLVLRADRSRIQFNLCLDYVPGSAVRGALAAAYLQRRGADPVFQALFLGRRASFGDLFPSTGNAAGHLLPATARSCKRFSLEHRRSVTDSLLRLALASILDDPAPLKGKWENCPEPECGQKRDRAREYLTRTLDTISVHRRILAGTAIQRATGTVEPRRLYSQEALEEGQFFRGVIRFDTDHADQLAQELEETLHVGLQLAIGSGRSRGMGVVEIVAWRDPFEGPPLESRFERFQEAWQKLWQHHGKAREGAFFSLTLTSHLLLQDRLGMPVGSFAERTDIATLFDFSGLRLVRHVLVPAVARGWNARQGLPKEDEPAVGRGSVLLFQAEPGKVDALLPRLKEAEEKGIGRRREEGFGRVQVCDPFHYQFLSAELEEKS